MLTSMLRQVGLVLALSFAGFDCSPSQERPPGTNRLIHESSPYLLLHARNPVDWHPWGEEAIELARELDRPIFLSVGYSTCYWCHRMEEDVFSDPEIAALMNEGFVNIKVDREERPDIDEIYMAATQLIARGGGWPNSLFLTPDLKPFFAGTYFPPEDRGARMGFPTVLRRIRELWRDDRARVEESAGEVASAMEEMLSERAAPAESVPPLDNVQRAVATLALAFDEDWGGFTPAPKFPSPANLFLLHQQALRGNEEAERMLVETLHHMGRGAIYDHLGGGFHRYATDREWRVPHFEKMLYDNAALAEILIDTARLTEDRELARWARGTLDFVLERLTHEQGGFLSAIDAQTEGREGAYYVFSREELEEVLTRDELDLLGPIFGFDGEPNFDEHLYTVYLTAPLTEHARRLGLSREALLAKMEPALGKLRAARAKRVFPLVDDKVLTDWNGMMIAAMAKGGAYFEAPRYLEGAKKAASFLSEELSSGGGILQHVWREGESRVDAFLEDYAFFMKGLVTLYRETNERRWLGRAERLAEEMESRLRDPNGGYYQTAPKPFLLFQTKGIFDGAVPSANGIVIGVLLDLAELTGKEIYRQRAEAAMRAFANRFQQYPSAAKTLAIAIARYHGEHGDAVAVAEAPPEASPTEELARSLVDASLETTGETTGAWQGFRVRMAIRDGWHVNANPASAPYLIPTEIRGSVREVDYPEGEALRFAFAEQAISVYGGEVFLRGQLRQGAESVVLVYQACDDARCLSPVEKVLNVP